MQFYFMKKLFDLFDFTSFFCLAFFKFSGPLWQNQNFLWVRYLVIEFLLWSRSLAQCKTQMLKLSNGTLVTGKNKTMFALKSFFCRYAVVVHSFFPECWWHLSFSVEQSCSKKRSLASKWAQSCETESLILSDFLLCNGPIHMVFLGIRLKSNELAQ